MFDKCKLVGDRICGFATYEHGETYCGLHYGKKEQNTIEYMMEKKEKCPKEKKRK